MAPAESTEFWLIQWPKDQLDVSDFHGKELSLKLHKDANIVSLESSSGKSYELVSFAAQQPDATVFQPSGSEMKPVGKISRRVCLVRYPEPEELTKPTFGGLTPSSKISAGSSRKTKSRFTSASKNRSSQGSALSLGQWSAEPTPKHKQKRKDKSSLGHSNQARPPKDHRLVGQRATPRPCRCRSLHRRRKRKLRSWSSSVALAKRSVSPELSAAAELCGKCAFVVPSCIPGSQFY